MGAKAAGTVSRNFRQSAAHYLYQRYPCCFFKRNRYIVDHADRIVAVFDGKRGGTAQTVRYAEKQGKQLVRLSPTGKVLEEDRQLRFPWEPV